MLLEAILSNKTKLRKLIVSVIQPPNADNKENIAVLINKIKEEEYLVKKTQAADIKKEKATKY